MNGRTFFRQIVVNLIYSKSRVAWIAAAVLAVVTLINMASLDKQMNAMEVRINTVEEQIITPKPNLVVLVPIVKDPEREYYIMLVKDHRVVDAILEESRNADIPSSLAFALVEKESSFDPKAVNKNRYSTDRGLFQLNDRVYSEATAIEFFDIEWNANKGVQHLLTELERFNGDLEKALVAYNAGPARVDNPPASTVKYVQKITEIRNRIERNLVAYKSNVGNNAYELTLN